MSDLSDRIEEVAEKAASSQKGDAKLTQHTLSDLIQADQHLGNVNAGGNANLGLRFRAQKPPGAWA